MNRERKIYRQRYYDSKVSQLKECKPSAWWNEVKKLSGMSSAVRDSNELMRSLQHVSEEPLSASDLANLINDTFLYPMQDFTPLSAEPSSCRKTIPPRIHLPLLCMLFTLS